MLESAVRMHPDLEKLVALQKAESDLKRLETDLGEIPRLKSALDDRVAAERGRLDAARSALDTCNKARKQHEAAVEDAKVRLSKFKSQLMDVKTNKEYTAVLHEIETVERDVREREDLVLVEMERAEGLQAEVKREEVAFKTVESEGKAENLALDARARKVEEEAKRLRAERDQVAETVPEEALALYRRVAKLRGVAVAEARDGMCQVCRVKLRLQRYVELKRNEKVFQCEVCNRILYYEPPPPVVAPTP
jgi:uncharacterized protein